MIMYCLVIFHLNINLPADSLSSLNIYIYCFSFELISSAIFLDVLPINLSFVTSLSITSIFSMSYELLLLHNSQKKVYFQIGLRPIFYWTLVLCQEIFWSSLFEILKRTYGSIFEKNYKSFVKLASSNVNKTHYLLDFPIIIFSFSSVPSE